MIIIGTKHMYEMCGKNLNHFNVKHNGKYSNHLKG